MMESKNTFFNHRVFADRHNTDKRRYMGSRKRLKTVAESRRSLITGLKPGVNDTQSNLQTHYCQPNFPVYPDISTYFLLFPDNGGQNKSRTEDRGWPGMVAKAESSEVCESVTGKTSQKGPCLRLFTGIHAFAPYPGALGTEPGFNHRWTQMNSDGRQE